MNPAAGLGVLALLGGAALLWARRAAASVQFPAGQGTAPGFAPTGTAGTLPGRPLPAGIGTPTATQPASVGAWTLPPLEWPRALPTVQDIFNMSMNTLAPTGAPAVQRAGWLPPEPWLTNAAPYIALAQSTETALGIPRGLLVRLLWQESNFNPRAVSGAGAQGIAQIVPAWHPGVDPFDPAEAIPYAGAYLARLKRRFGTWALALAAYNWGEGNLSTKGIAAAPPETRAYVAAITADAGVA